MDLTEQVIRLWESKYLSYDGHAGVSGDNARLSPDNPAVKDYARLNEENKGLLNTLQVSRHPHGCVEV